MNNDLSAAEAAHILGVTLPTLYSYVSRGLLVSGSSGTARRKRYRHEDVLRLAARKGDGKRGGRAAVDAINWGLPVLETRISQIADGQLFYGGKNAVALAGHSTLESTASLLWDDGATDHFAQALPSGPAPLLASVLALAPDTQPLARAMACMPLLAQGIPGDMFQSGPSLMRLLAAVLLQSAPSALPLHLQLAMAWDADAAQADLLRAALVLLAEHELNASTFAVRCVASTGADLSAALGAGMAALSGARHGGGSAAAKRMLTGALAAPAPDAFIRNYYAAIDPDMAGFGHPLYPHGDPRAACLLASLANVAQVKSQATSILAICALGGELLDMRPNADLALAACELACGWPDGAGTMLFALARSAGWIAHAAEQAGTAAMIRPRARYVGRYRPD